MSVVLSAEYGLFEVCTPVYIGAVNGELRQGQDHAVSVPDFVVRVWDQCGDL